MHFESSFFSRITVTCTLFQQNASQITIRTFAFRISHNTRAPDAHIQLTDRYADRRKQLQINKYLQIAFVRLQQKILTNAASFSSPALSIFARTASEAMFASVAI